MKTHTLTRNDFRPNPQTGEKEVSPTSYGACAHCGRRPEEPPITLRGILDSAEADLREAIGIYDQDPDEAVNEIADSHVPVYNYDRAMLISDKTKGNPDRLGADGPRLSRSVPGKVTLIDCTPVVHGLVEHSYFIDSPRVTEDMLHVLAGEQPDTITGREYAADTNRFRLVRTD